MSRIIYSILLVFVAFSSFGQNSALPQAIQTPADSSKLILHVYAKGFQQYVCMPDPKDGTKYTWTLQGVQADLYADSAHTKRLGKHYFNADKKPVWEHIDGSMVTGVKLRQAGAPDGVSIPWLLVKIKEAKRNGVLTPVVFVQRVRTNGGNATASPTEKDRGKSASIPYIAEYLFYGAK